MSAAESPFERTLKMEQFISKAFEAKRAGFAYVCITCGAGLDEQRRGTHEDGCEFSDAIVTSAEQAQELPAKRNNRR